MKKLLCFLVVLSMALSVFSITSFATTVETTVWTQGFEKDADLGLNNNKTGTYANGARYHSNGSAWTKQTGIKTENDGKFYATVTNIPSEYFGEKVACKPYVVVYGKVIFGDVVTYAVNDGNKYLGAKGE